MPARYAMNPKILKSPVFKLSKARKTSFIMIILLPFVYHAWRFFPENVAYEHYGELHIFLWTLGAHLVPFLITLAWYFTLPKKDYLLHFLVLTCLGYCCYLLIGTIPPFSSTPLWIDLVVAFAFTAAVYFLIEFIKKKYYNYSTDYKELHDGLIHDIHHSRFLGNISRVEGLIELSEMEDEYKEICKNQLEELRGNIAYIADKYDNPE